MTELQIWTMAAVIALVTAALRFLPFVVFNGKRKTPATVEKLGRLLPCAVMGMLVVYCLKGMHFSALSGFLPTCIAGLVVALLYLWKRSTLLSIIVGTLCYMVLVQQIF
ncbi:MAG: AzlD domain-containing protein [Clostridia bacterium]|nr:AzlD domain-containing protein [Clostridia bacterium]MBQ3091813.1 AzlD domain-containing protein [Clostridia bacterium]MBQ9924973.1 AzlD domain-containing protein [Clostridia bacterium]